MASPRNSVREQKLARVIDREVAPIWHDRFARLMMRELPSEPGTVALDIHSGPGHTTAELLQRLGDDARVVALGRDPWLMQVAKAKVRPEWKRRVYFKAGDFDDVTEMGDDSYDLSIANLVLGEQVIDWKAALAELLRVTRPGGQVLVTMPLHGSWQEVEDLFEELLRDEGMRKQVSTLQQLRRRRPKTNQLVSGLHELGLSEEDFVLEHERFELLFRSGREFLFAPVIEHGPLRLWKAILGRAEKPQALFWRFKESIDTYYAGHVLGVTVIAGVLRLRVPEPGAPSFSASYWSRYPQLSRIWRGETEGGDEEFDLDIEMDFDEGDERDQVDAGDSQPALAERSITGMPADSAASLRRTSADSGSSFSGEEASIIAELPPVDDVSLDDQQDPFAGLLDELEAEEVIAAEIAAEDAESESKTPRKPTPTGKAATLGGALEPSESGVRLISKRAGDSGSSPIPGRLPRKPGDSGSSPIPGRLPRKPGDSGSSPIPGRLPRKPGDSGVSPIPSRLPRKPGDSGVGPAPRRDSVVGPPPRRPGDSGVGPAPRRDSVVGPPPRRPGDSGVGLAPRRDSVVGPPPRRPGDSGVGLAPRRDSVVGPPPRKPGDSVVGPAPKPPRAAKASALQPTATPPGGGDPFAAMLDDDDDLEEIDSVDLAAEELEEPEELEDLDAIFEDLEPKLESRKPPPLPPKPKS
ncbi:methyltransferase domain-containing protein [Pseudenhygromyxa sp. WMMC2535]|uniref:methyltransferase domain-containing protein n=1 Tax=Pseudenhygromyxa sp. WMMC2535 TaxID=2712867 RepID=UPI0015960965|nr:methyltransferase domain-containing protein [Pseudenhygromyxa sp. WMMC2535]